MGHSIYLADDEKSIRELLHSFLASDGYTVRSFESGDALLEAFRQEPAELVILDIMMPGTDGLAVCRELRSVSDIPIILLTAKDSELDYVMGISHGQRRLSHQALPSNDITDEGEGAAAPRGDGQGENGGGRG